MNENEGPVTPGDGPGAGYASVWWIAVTAIALVAGLLVVVAGLINFWPTGGTNAIQTISVTGVSFVVNHDGQLFLIVALSGALGSFLHGLRSFAWYVGNRNLRSSWLLGYYLRPLTGAALAALVYIVLRAGLISAQTGVDSSSPYGFAALAGLAGLFSEQASSKLKDIFEVIFTKAPQGSEPVVPLRLQDFDPKSVAVGQEITINGSGFTKDVVVRFTGADATPTMDSATRLRVKVPTGARTGPLGLARGTETVTSVGELQVSG